MKKLLVAIAFLFCFVVLSHSGSAQKRKTYKDKRVKSYTTKKGTRVKAHKRSKPSRRSRTYVMPLALPKEIAA